jgi:outer membrane protein insertion porin family
LLYKKTLLFVLCLSLSLPLHAEEAPKLTLDTLLEKAKTIGTKSEKNKALQKNSLKASSQTKTIKIASISINGLQHIEKSRILKSLTIKKGDTFNTFKLQRNIKTIESLGWFQSVTHTHKKDLNGEIISITLKENPLIKKVLIHGNKTYSSKELLGIAQSKPNDVYNINTARKDIKRIEGHYKDNGYFQSKIIRILSPEKTNGNVEFFISEGVIENITITGNIKTQDYVIIRELELQPGQTLREKDLKENLRRVYNLSYFNDVRPNIRPSLTSPNAYDLELILDEKETMGSFSFGGGYSPTSGFSLFSDLFWNNMFGTSQLVLLKGNFGLGTGQSDRSSTYQFKYHNPWMWDKRKSFTFRTWLTDGQFNSINPLAGTTSLARRDERRRGLDSSIGIPHTYDFRSSHKVKYESISLPDINDGYNIYSYTLGLSYDTKDYRGNPREGVYHTLNLEQGFKFRHRALEFTQADLTLRKFIPTLPKQAIALKANYGYIRSPEIGDADKFRSQYYFVGGTYSVRGYDDFYPFAFGNAKAVYSTEYRFIFKGDFSVYLFADAGFADMGHSGLKNLKNYQIGKGIGTKFLAPGLGPIRLDLGADDEGVFRIHFNIGHSF